MPLPSLDQYNEAVQNPKTAFRDSLLKTGTVQKSGMGLPLALSGGFALTYSLACQGGRKYAVRCFHKPIDHLERHYRQISDHLKRTRDGYFLECDYQAEGVRIGTAWFPIVKMEWAKGEPLGTFVERHYSDSALLTRLRHKFAALDADLRQQGIAHGDLQNGNVMVDGENIRLIDYDGMFVRGMPRGSGTELGHKHFQHPRRTPSDFGPDLDRFSFIVLDLSLHALSVVPKLFDKYSNGENIIFTANDFAQPQQSPLFQELLSQPELKVAAERFADICAGEIGNVPLLDEFQRVRSASGVSSLVTVAPGTLQKRAKYLGALPVFSGADFAAVEKNIGNRVEIIGRVADVRMGKAVNSRPYVFLDFGPSRSSIVKVNIWSEGLAKLRTQPDKTWVGKWVSVTGLVDSPYRRPGFSQLSVTVTEQSQLHVITQEEAEYRLGIPPKKDAVDVTPKPTRPNVLPPKPLPQPKPAVAAPTAAQNKQTLEKIEQLRGGTKTQAATQSPSGQTKPGNSGCLISALIVAAIAGLIAMFQNNAGSTSPSRSGTKVSSPSTPTIPFGTGKRPWH